MLATRREQTATEDAQCPICLETMFPIEEVSSSFCKHYCHLDCYNKMLMAERWGQSTRCFMCRRYQPDEQDVLSILKISEDHRADNYPPQIETRELFNPLGQLILKDFENGALSRTMLDDWAFAKLPAQAEEEDSNQP